MTTLWQPSARKSPVGLNAKRMLATKGRAIGEGEPMTSLAVLHGVDAVTVPVPDLDQGFEFCRDQLGHELVWRNDAVGQVGLRLPESRPS
jgi:hypothetical protein